MKVRVLGSGCSKCHPVEDNSRRAAEQSDRDVKVETIYDRAEASSMGTMDAPGLAINDERKIKGRVPDSSKKRRMEFPTHRPMGGFRPCSVGSVSPRRKNDD